MAGMNDHYHISMNGNLKYKLKERANKEGLHLSELIRIIFWDWLRKDIEASHFKRIEEKLDKLLKKR